MSFQGRLRVHGNGISREHSLIPIAPEDQLIIDSAFYYIDADGVRHEVTNPQLCNVRFVPRRRCASDSAASTPRTTVSVLNKVLAQFLLPVEEFPRVHAKEQSKLDGIFTPADEDSFQKLRSECAAAGRPLIAAFVAVPSCHCQLFFPALRELWTQHRKSATFACIDLCRTSMPGVARHVPSIPYFRVYLPDDHSAHGKGLGSAEKVGKLLTQADTGGQPRMQGFCCFCF